MRRVLWGLVAVLAAGSSHADEMHSFTTVVNNMWWYQTLIYCVEPVSGRVPKGCILSQPAEAYPNHRNSRPHTIAVICAAGHPIDFYPNGTLAHCKLDGEQQFDLQGPPGFGYCFEHVTFDENGRADCD